MLLTSSISNTKRFFQKTLQSFKSFFSAEHAVDYHKLPKTPDMNGGPQTSSQDRRELESSKPKMNKKIMGPRRRNDYEWKGKGNSVQHDLYSKSEREARSLAVATKLKEMEMMDMSNVDHVLDIEEVLHYYSRLTCPVYLDIVDKFFMDMYKEFLGPSTASPKSVYRSVMI